MFSGVYPEAMSDTPTIRAGAPLHNPWLYHRAPVHTGDPAVLLELDGRTVMILRDIEIPRAKQAKAADEIHAYADFTPDRGLASDRETSAAQSAAECLSREGVKKITADRSLPEIYAHYLRERGIDVVCDPELGVRERRMKSQREIDALEAAQQKTEKAVEFACRLIARAECGKGGVLMHEGEELTSERVQAEINVFLLREGMGTSTSIAAVGDDAADCHERGTGKLYTGQTIIIDVFPMDPSSRYHGDCTRTVVHGEVPADVAKAHAAVVEAKDAGIAYAKAGATGDGLHKTCVGILEKHGYSATAPTDGSLPTEPTMVHGTGHGVGLDVHEPPLLAPGGPELLRGDCLTIEPGLYAKGFGGIRVEDMVIVTDEGCINLNTIQTGLDWS